MISDQDLLIAPLAGREGSSLLGAALDSMARSCSSTRFVRSVNVESIHPSRRIAAPGNCSARCTRTSTDMFGPSASSISTVAAVSRLPAIAGDFAISSAVASIDETFALPDRVSLSMVGIVPIRDLVKNSNDVRPTLRFRIVRAVATWKRCGAWCAAPELVAHALTGAAVVRPSDVGPERAWRLGHERA